MKQMICKTSDVLPEGHVRVFPFLGRNVQVCPSSNDLEQPR